MIAAAEFLETALLANEDLQEVVNGAHFWELAPDNQKGAFINFRIIENTRASKDRRGDYDVQLFCYSKTITAAAQLSELVKDALDHLNYRGAISGYADSPDKEGFIQLNYNFKL